MGRESTRRADLHQPGKGSVNTEFLQIRFILKGLPPNSIQGIQCDDPVDRFSANPSGFGPPRKRDTSGSENAGEPYEFRRSGASQHRQMHEALSHAPRRQLFRGAKGPSPARKYRLAHLPSDQRSSYGPPSLVIKKRTAFWRFVWSVQLIFCQSSRFKRGQRF